MIFRCDNLALGYDSKIVLADISFTVNAGDYLCIVGENGSGKSTLMKTLLGLQSPLEGKIVMGEGFSSHVIGYLPQQTVVQKDFPASVREVVRSGCLGRRVLRPFYTTGEKELAENNMKRLGIGDLATQCYRELSGGQQQRVLLARALCAAENLLLLDEPVSGLDPQATADMYALLAELNGEGITIIMISHDMAASLQYASHILHIGGRKVLFFGSKTDYREREQT